MAYRLKNELAQTGADWRTITENSHSRKHSAQAARTWHELAQTGANIRAIASINPGFLRVSACASPITQLAQHWRRLAQRRAGGFAPVITPFRGVYNWATNQRRPCPKLTCHNAKWEVVAP